MKAKYIIQFSQGQPYPFSGSKDPFFSVNVRTYIQYKNKDREEIKQKLNVITQLKSFVITKLLRIVEESNKGFQLDFEYVPQLLKTSVKIHQPLFIHSIHDTLIDFCKELAQNGIRYNLRAEDIGISQSQQIKIFFGVSFDIVKNIQPQKLMQEYVQMIEKVLENLGAKYIAKQPSENTIISDHSLRITKKLSEMEERLCKVKKRSSFSSSKRSKEGQSTKNIVYQSIANKKSISTTSNSFVFHKHIANTKTHKFSFAQFGSSNNNSSEQSDKESSLQKRINNALNKTEQAFKVYQKFSRRKNRKRS